jgi:hypothetical protein
LLALVVLSVAGACVILLFPHDPTYDFAGVAVVGESKTNGQHWVIFRFDAPRGKAATIASIAVVGSNNVAFTKLPGDGTVVSIPDSTVPIQENTKSGHSKYFQVRQVGGGEWRLRLALLIRLGFVKQHSARIADCWRTKGLKPWARNYVERGYRIIESQIVSTTEAIAQEPPHSAPFMFQLWPLSPTE